MTVLEKEAIERALRRAEGNITRAAELLGLPALPCIVNWRNLAYDTLLVVRSYFGDRGLVFYCLILNAERVLFIPALFGFCILALSVFLYKDQQKTVKRMEYLIESIHYGDLSLFYPSDSMTEDEKALASSMNAALEALRSRLYSSVVAEAETEAWQKLIRVLTHEIMNSIAPVISLSETVAERATINGMNEKDYAIMVQAMQTIHRRSKGLLDFVENYRKLTRLPLPTLRNFSVSALFDDIRLLFPEKSDILFFHVKPEDLNLYADRIMVEQVLINLLKNAIEACEESSSPQIIVEAVQKRYGNYFGD